MKSVAPEYMMEPAYGGKCGTFLRIAVKDPTKKACILEKKIPRLEKKCTQGGFLVNKRIACSKLQRAQAELLAIASSIEAPLESLQAAEDIQMAYYQAQLMGARTQYVEASPTTTQTLMLAMIGGVTAILALTMLRK